MLVERRLRQGHGAAAFAGASEKPAFTCYGAAAFAEASEKPPSLRYGAAAFAEAKTGRSGIQPLLKIRQSEAIPSSYNKKYTISKGCVGLLEPRVRRAGLVGVFGLSADGGGSLHDRLGRITGLHPDMG